MSNQKVERFGIIELLVSATAFIAAFLFFTGWSYLSYYLGHFNVNLHEFQNEYNTIIIYSFRVFFNSGILFVIIGLSVVYLLLDGLFKIQNSDFNLVFKYIGLIFGPVLFAVIAVYYSAETAARDAKEVWEGNRARMEHMVAPNNGHQTGDRIYRGLKVCSDRRNGIYVYGDTAYSLILCRYPNMPRTGGMVYLVSRDGKISFRRRAEGFE